MKFTINQLLITVLFISCVFTQQLFAQNSKWQIGVYFSPDLNIQEADLFKGADKRAYLDVGFTTGIMTLYKLSNTITLGTGLQYKYRRFEQDGSIEISPLVEDKSLLGSNFWVAGSTAHMIGIPLQLRYTLVPNKKVGAYLMAGYNINWLSNESVGYGSKSKMFNSDYYYTWNRVNSFSFSQWFNYFELGFGIAPRLSKRLILDLQPTYRLRNDGEGALTKNIGFVFGLSYQL